MFGANYIKGKIHAQPNGNFIGEVKFKLTFKSGGAIEFGQAMLKAAHLGIQCFLFICYLYDMILFTTTINKYFINLIKIIIRLYLYFKVIEKTLYFINTYINNY